MNIFRNSWEWSIALWWVFLLVAFFLGWKTGALYIVATGLTLWFAVNEIERITQK